MTRPQPAPLTLTCRDCGGDLTVRRQAEAWDAGWWIVTNYPAEGQTAQCPGCYRREWGHG